MGLRGEGDGNRDLRLAWRGTGWWWCLSFQDLQGPGGGGRHHSSLVSRDWRVQVWEVCMAGLGLGVILSPYCWRPPSGPLTSP